jgi:hypothetical protein
VANHCVPWIDERGVEIAILRIVRVAVWLFCNSLYVRTCLSAADGLVLQVALLF